MLVSNLPNIVFANKFVTMDKFASMYGISIYLSSIYIYLPIHIITKPNMSCF